MPATGRRRAGGSGWRRGDRGGACGRSAVVPWWWLRCASLRKSLYRGTVYRDGKTSYLRTETEMRAANPEPASALWPRHIVAHGGWDMRSRACRAPDSTCDPRGSTQTGAQRAARPPIAAHPGEADHITHTRGYTRDAPFRAQGSAAGVADCQSAPRHNYPVNQSTTATLPSITTPGKRTAMSRPSRHHERRTARSHL